MSRWSLLFTEFYVNSGLWSHRIWLCFQNVVRLLSLFYLFLAGIYLLWGVSALRDGLWSFSFVPREISLTSNTSRTVCPGITMVEGMTLNCLHQVIFLQHLIVMTFSCWSTVKQLLPHSPTVESPNFFLQIHTATQDTTSLSSSSRKLLQKNCRKYCTQRLPVEFLDNGFSKDHEILHT